VNGHCGPAADHMPPGGDVSRAPAGKPYVSLQLRLRRAGSPGGGKSFSEDSLANRQLEIESVFSRLGGDQGGIGIEDFMEVTKHICRFPSFFNTHLFNRIVSLYDDG